MHQFPRHYDYTSSFRKLQVFLLWTFPELMALQADLFGALNFPRCDPGMAHTNIHAVLVPSSARIVVPFVAYLTTCNSTSTM
jgi:hypothetical protein